MTAPDESRDPSGQTPAPPQREPDLDREESVPVDGKDVEGEKLMKEVSNDQLENPPPKE